MYRHPGKRILDLVLASVATLLLLPIMIVIIALIKSTDPGPAFFIQGRVGRDGRQFRLYKFRSMPVGTGDLPSGEVGEIPMSWVGRLIRRTNFDELPQLFNVLAGNMSLVGPRPPLPSQERLIQMRRQNGALRCKPGLTGLAQVNSFDGMSETEKAAFDGRYARRITLLGDLSIIVRTFAYLAKRPPVY